GAAAAAAILPAGQMDVDDGVTFVAAAGGLIDSPWCKRVIARGAAIGLTGQRKGAAAAAAILPAGQMDVDDGVTFVAAAGGLIDS
ncbi:hypothetical protein CQA61_29935, partial [Klebsiella pneumoniae]